VIEHDKRALNIQSLKKHFERENIVMKKWWSSDDTESKSLAILVEDIEESGNSKKSKKLLDAGRGILMLQSKPKSAYWISG